MATLVPSTETPRLRQSAAWRTTFDAMSTRLGHPAPLASARLPGVCATSALHPPTRHRPPRVPPRRQRHPGLPDASEAYRLLTPHFRCGPRRLRPPGRGASSPASIGEPSAFVYLSSSGSSKSVGSASVPGSPATSPAASPAPSEQPLRDAGGTSTPTPHIGVPTPTGVPVDSPVPGSPRSSDPASPRPSSSARQALVPYDFGPSSSSNGASPAPRGSSAASAIGDAAFLLDDDDDNTLSYDVAVFLPPLDARSSPVVLPGSPVSPASSPSPPASVDEAAADPDEELEQPESHSATLQMPLDHTRLLEDQARLLRSLLQDTPSDESWAQCEEAWTRAVTLAAAAVRLPPEERCTTILRTMREDIPTRADLAEFLTLCRFLAEARVAWILGTRAANTEGWQWFGQLMLLLADVATAASGKAMQVVVHVTAD
ncbi:hypothetical protein MRX96_046359 [Rhipicephalus microplus]